LLRWYSFRKARPLRCGRSQAGVCSEP
jgi:hypothetical protein